MKNLFIILLVTFLVSGCATTVSMLVDGKPTLTPEELSWKLAKRYSEIGLKTDLTTIGPSRSKLGEWGWWDKKCGGGVHHDVRNGMLSIWIFPYKNCVGAPEMKVKIIKLLSEIAPDALVQVNEASTPDFR